MNERVSRFRDVDGYLSIKADLAKTSDGFFSVMIFGVEREGGALPREHGLAKLLM